MSYKETKYLKIEWPDYQYFMDKPNVYFCEKDNTYFVPEELVNNISKN